MHEVTVGLIALGGVLVLFLTGIELGFAMALVGFLGFAVLVSTKAALNLLAKDFFDVFASYGFTVIPLFILMGQIAFNAGIARRLFNTAYRFIGHVPGGMAMATVAGATAFKALCGSSPATAATFASVAVPEMDRYGYDKKLSTGIVATVGTLGILIPPSVTLIVFGIITELSIGKLFLAGIIPGLIIAFFFICHHLRMVQDQPEVGSEGRKINLEGKDRFSPGVSTGRGYLPVDDMGIDEGAFYAYGGREHWDRFSPPYVYLKKGHQFQGVPQIDCRIFAHGLHGPHAHRRFHHPGSFPRRDETSHDCSRLGGGPSAEPLPHYDHYQLHLSDRGSFIDDLAFMILATPIFYPVIIKLGFDPIWFGMIIAITVMIGVVIPPVAINVFVVKNITKVPFSVIYSGVYPFLISLVVCGALLFFFPQLALWLPNLLMH